MNRIWNLVGMNAMVLVSWLFVLLLQHVRLTCGLFKFNNQIQLANRSYAGLLLLKKEHDINGISSNKKLWYLSTIYVSPFQPICFHAVCLSELRARLHHFFRLKRLHGIMLPFSSFPTSRGRSGNLYHLQNLMLTVIWIVTTAVMMMKKKRKSMKI
jgi:hypothetical protein